MKSTPPPRTHLHSSSSTCRLSISWVSSAACCALEWRIDTDVLWLWISLHTDCLLSVASLSRFLADAQSAGFGSVAGLGCNGTRMNCRTLGALVASNHRADPGSRYSYSSKVIGNEAELFPVEK